MNEDKKPIRIATLFNSNQGAIYDIGGIAPCITAAFHGYANGYIVLHRCELWERNNVGERIEETPQTVDCGI